MTAPSLWAFPRHDGRLLTADPGIARSPLGNARSRKAAALWKLGQTRLGRAIAWRPADEVETAGWEVARAHLGVKSTEPGLVAVLGERGPARRLILIAQSSRWVVKVPIGTEAASTNRQEIANYLHVAQRAGDPSPWLPRARLLADDSLLVEHLAGPHPRWDDKATIEWIMTQFRWPGSGGAIPHCDLAPWNVIVVEGRPRVIDWEMADLGLEIQPEFNAMDFILRGAAVARANPEDVIVVLARHGLYETLRPAYLAYRRRLRNAGRDGLADRVERLLREP